MIQEFKFGSFKIDGKRYTDDIKIVNGKVRNWPDRDKHNLTMDNLKDLLASSPELIIVGIGATGLLQVPQEIQEALMLRRIKLVVDKTPGACDAYNAAVKENKRVAALFHATC